MNDICFVLLVDTHSSWGPVLSQPLQIVTMRLECLSAGRPTSQGRDTGGCARCLSCREEACVLSWAHLQHPTPTGGKARNRGTGSISPQMLPAPFTHYHWWIIEDGPWPPQDTCPLCTCAHTDTQMITHRKRRLRWNLRTGAILSSIPGVDVFNYWPPAAEEEQLLPVVHLTGEKLYAGARFSTWPIHIELWKKKISLSTLKKGVRIETRAMGKNIPSIGRQSRS